MIGDRENSFWTRHLTAVEMFGLVVVACGVVLLMGGRERGFRPRVLGVASVGVVFGCVLGPLLWWARPYPGEVWFGQDGAWGLALGSVAVGLVPAMMFAMIGLAGESRVFGSTWLVRFVRWWCWRRVGGRVE